MPDRLAPPRRWCAVGRSDVLDAHAAGRQAATDALAHDGAKLLVVFCSDDYDLEALARGLAEVAGDVPLIGCTTAGEIATSGPGDAGVVVFALGGDGFSAATAVAPGSAADPRCAGARAAACVSDLGESEHRVLILLSDGMAGGQQDVVRGAYGVAGANVPIVGGCAGDQLKMQRTFQIFGGQVLQDAVVAAALGSDAPLGVGVHHGWRKVGDEVFVTASGDSRVHTLDDQPALDVYLDRLDAPAEVRSDPAAFTAFAMTHPLGIERRSGIEVRMVAGADFEDRSLQLIADMPQGGMASFLRGDDDSVLGATDRACEAALDAIGGAPIGMLAFDCVARRGVIGDDGIGHEIHRILGHAAGGELAGFYGYGEFARTRGINGFHNQTLVVLALA
jgi:hypothetical protein